MLTFWTDTDPTTFRDVVADSLAGLEPAVSFRRLAYEEGVPVFPEAGEVVVAMGQGPLDEIRKIGAVAKNKSLSSLRETTVPYKVQGVNHLAENAGQGEVKAAHWMFSFSPNSIYVEADKRSQVAWDARLAHRFYTTGSLEPQLGTYGWVDVDDDAEYWGFAAVIAYVEMKYAETSRAVSVALDLETMGLVPWYEDKDIVTVQVSVEPGYADLAYMLDPIWKEQPAKLKRLLEQLRWLLTSPKVALCGANLKYDIIWMWVKWGLRPTNFKMDTLLVGSLLDENRSNSLKQHAKEHTTIGGYELPLEKWFKEHKLDKGRMEMVPKDILIDYAGPDPDATLRVAIYQRKELQVERGLQRLYVKLVHPAARAFEAIEYRGLQVDMGAFKELETELTTEIAKLETQCLAMMPARLRAKFAGTGDMLRAAVLQEFFFTKSGLNLKPLMYTPTGKIKTDKAHFLMFEDHPEAGPFIKVLRECNSAKHMLSTYCHGFLNHLRPDGRFHPTYMLFNGSAFEGKDDDGGTDTGRTSAVDPAVQTIPKHNKWAKKIRKCYPAPPGYRFFQADFSQGEARITASVAEEPNLIDTFQQGKDIHCVTGAQLAGYEYDEFMLLKALKDKEGLSSKEKELLELFIKYRQIAKSANFGLLYGMQSEGFREYARVSTEGKVQLTSEEAEKVHQQFFELYAGLIDWHQNNIAHATQHGYICNPLGRIAHLPLIKSKIWAVRSKAERKAINSPIQSCLSDLCMWAISFLEERYAGEGLWMAGMTHDSIYGYYPESGDPAIWLGRIVEVMETLPYREVFDWHPVLDFPADIEEGPNLAELTEFKLAA